MAQFNLTIQWMKESFNKYNNKYWGGKLHTPIFEIIHTKNKLGEYTHRLRLLRISDKYDRPEKDYSNTLLHEMIHLYIRQNGIIDTNRHHGREFYREADRLNRYGWHIARTDSVSGLGLTNGGSELYHIAVFKCDGGKAFMMSINENYLGYMKSKIMKYSKGDAVFFTSTDDKKYAALCKCYKRLTGKFISVKEYNDIKNEYEKEII